MSHPLFSVWRPTVAVAAVVSGLAACSGNPSVAHDDSALRNIDTLVVIYAENRGFDNLYGLFPGANGIPGVNPSARGTINPQVDVDGAVLPVLPPTWGGATVPGQSKVLTQAQSAGLPNKPFRIEAADSLGLDSSIITRDLVHRFYNNQMQIHDGKNDQFATYSDAGGLSLGYYDGSNMAMWCASVS